MTWKVQDESVHEHRGLYIYMITAFSKHFEDKVQILYMLLIGGHYETNFAMKVIKKSYLYQFLAAWLIMRAKTTSYRSNLKL